MDLGLGRFVRGVHLAAAHGGNNPVRHGEAHVHRITNGKDHIAHVQFVAVGDFNGGKILRLDF